MFPEKQKTYPGRQFVQVIQVALVIAIGIAALVSFSRSDEDVDEPFAPPPTATLALVPTQAPIESLSDEIDRLYDQAWSAHNVDRHEQAIDLYTQVIELDPTLANAWLGRAVAYAELGENLRLSRNDFWRYVQNMETERIERSVTDDQTLTLGMEEGRVYALSVNAEAGDRIDVTVDTVVQGEPDEEGVVDPLILLFDPSDEILEADDDTLRSDGTIINMDAHLDDVKVTEDGTYMILVTHAGGGSFGDLEVTVRVR